MTRPIYDHLYVDVDFDAARRTLVSDPTGWLPDPAQPEGDGFVVDLHDGEIATIAALVSLGMPRYDAADHRFVQPISWHAVDHARRYPRMTAALELSPLTHGSTQLTFVGEYRLPAGALGEAFDRVSGHHIAENVVRDLLEAVAAHLVERSRTPAG